jgi:hypothetical protein
MERPEVTWFGLQAARVLTMAPHYVHPSRFSPQVQAPQASRQAIGRMA